MTLMPAYLPQYHKPNYPDTDYSMFPRPEDYLFPDHKNLVDGHKGLLPYEDYAIIEFMQEMKIKFPWDRLYTRADGKSVCQQCGTVYAGYVTDGYCTAKNIKLWEWRDKRYSYGGGEKKWGTPPSLGEYATNRQFSYRNCDRTWRPEWKGEQDFRMQQNFFASVAQSMKLLGRTGVSVQIGHSQIVSDHMPTIVAQQLQIAELEQKLQALVDILRSHHEAFNMIASKMNAAGNALHF